MDISLLDFYLLHHRAWADPSVNKKEWCIYHSNCTTDINKVNRFVYARSWTGLSFYTNEIMELFVIRWTFFMLKTGKVRQQHCVTARFLLWEATCKLLQLWRVQQFHLSYQPAKLFEMLDEQIFWNLWHFVCFYHTMMSRIGNYK